MKIRTTSMMIICGAATMLTAAAANADTVIVPGTYQMHNHPDGGAASPFYGLRLDEVIDVTGGHDIFTFDFDHDDAAMFLDYGADGSIHIYGTAFGGLDIGSEYDPAYQGLVQIDFTYNNVEQVPGDDDLWVENDNPANTGTIELWTGEVVDLWDEAGNHDYTFQLGNHVDDNGHRGFDGISGWGWLNHHDPDAHVYASDWLFTLESSPIPAPGALAAFGLAFGMRRRRRQA